ncbi:MAG: hypothetical protein ACYDHY_08345 [Acidiferrobacterales bacterium]
MRQWRRIRRAGLGCVLGLLFAASAYAGPALDVHAGSLGGGLGLTFGVARGLDVRAGFNVANATRTVTSDNIRYDGQIKFQTVGALADWYPFDGAFRLSAGLYYNDNKADLTAFPDAGGTYTIDGNTYTAAQVGSLTGTVRFNRSSPYIGLGFGNPMRGGPWTFMLDVGALYQGSPKVNLSASGTLANPQLAADIASARQTAESDAAKYRWWPLVQLGLGYRF